ncbi:MAG: OmcA/MtrC family decaheme c-type cytochrome [Polyangiaceae bacterium]
MLRFPFLAAGAAGLLLTVACDGDQGKAGVTGDSCTVVDNDDGTLTITCGDTVVTVPAGGQGTPGDSGPPGDPGEAGPPGEAGISCTLVDNNNGTKTITCTDGTTITVSDALKDYNQLTDAEKAALDPTLKIIKVDFPSTGKPVITMLITDRNGNPVTGMDSLTSGAGLTWRASVLKLVVGTPSALGVNGAAIDTWVSYNAANATSSASTESANSSGTATAGQGTLIDLGDGTYTYTFDKNITDEANAGTKYEADKTHRVVVLAYKSGNPFRPMDAWMDLIPQTGSDETGKNEKINQDSCMKCHSDFKAPANATAAFHSGTRYDVGTCVACHNDQRRFSSSGSPNTEPTMTAGTTPGTVKWSGNASVINGEAVINMPVFIHKIHMGEELRLKPDRANGSGQYSAVQYDEVTYAQDVRNCEKCHNTAAKADNWETGISRRACGACHDDISFVSPAPVGRKMHSGLAQPDDTGCSAATCHGGAGKVAGYHEPVAPPNTITSGTLPDSPDGQYRRMGWQWDSVNNKGVSGTVASPLTCTLSAPCLPSANSNAAWMAAAGYVPTGAAQITYDVSAVKLDANKNPQIVFKLKKDGTDVDFGTYDATNKPELLTGFVGSPSAYFAYTLPQDGIAAPVDFNATTSKYIRTCWINGPSAATDCKLEKDATTGYYTLTVLSTTLPSTAKFLTGGIGYTYSMSSTQPLTQTDLTGFPYNATTKIGGLIVPAPNVWKATGTNSSSMRRSIVETARCNNCHDGLGVTPTYHSGQRNDGPTCSFCHNPNRVNSGWAVNAKDIIHAIHGGGKRNVPFTWHGEIKAWEVTYPGVLNTCTQCHVPGGYDFSVSSTANNVPNMLYSYAATGSGYDPNPVAPATVGPFISPYVTPNTAYGSGYTTSGTRTVGTQYTGANTAPAVCSAGSPCTCSQANPCFAEDTTLVHSPITAACGACHDSTIAQNHFKAFGGSYYAPRGTALNTQEQCLMCHGKGKIAAIAEVHK